MFYRLVQKRDCFAKHQPSVAGFGWLQPMQKLSLNLAPFLLLNPVRRGAQVKIYEHLTNIAYVLQTYSLVFVSWFSMSSWSVHCSSPFLLSFLCVLSHFLPFWRASKIQFKKKHIKLRVTEGESFTLHVPDALKFIHFVNIEVNSEPCNLSACSGRKSWSRWMSVEIRVVPSKVFWERGVFQYLSWLREIKWSHGRQYKLLWLITCGFCFHADGIHSRAASDSGIVGSVNRVNWQIWDGKEDSSQFYCESIHFSPIWSVAVAPAAAS